MALRKGCQIIAPNFDAMPKELRALPQWVLWRAEGTGGELRKVPYSPTAPDRRASSTNPKSWGSFERAKAAYLERQHSRAPFSGIGFVVNGNGIVAGDLDNCVRGGVPDPAANALAQSVGAGYVEVSPSGTGLRFFGFGPNLGKGAKGRIDGLDVELYSSRRFLTLTGQPVKSGPLVELSGFAELAARICESRSGGEPTVEPARGSPDDRHAEWVRRILTGEVYHDSLRNLAAALAAARVPPHVIRRHLEALMDASTAPHDDRWKARRASIPALVNSAMAKFAVAEFADMESANDGGVLAPITVEELKTARTSPRVLVPGFLYCCVRTRIAAGGVGKTTLALYEAATLALGRELWGRTPPAPVKTAIVTREDDRELIVGRLREIMRAMGLTDDEQQTVLDRVRVLDLSAKPFRLSVIEGDVVQPNKAAIDWLLGVLRGFAPDWIIFDPMVSFGVGEARVNDAEQGLIEAARVVKAGLGCCVEYIHHSGKQNAREKALDQYAGRGGSAAADGARMVAVLQPLDPGEWLKATGTPLADGESGLVLALPKLSYAPKQDPIYIKRSGYRFTHQQATPQTPELAARARENRLWQFLRDEYDAGRKHNGKTLEASTETLGLSRQQVRDALAALKVSGRVVGVGKTTAPGFHLMPLAVADDGGESDQFLTGTEGV